MPDENKPADKKTDEELRRECLFYLPKNGYDVVAADEIGKCHEFSESYKDFLNKSRTEREAVSTAVAIAKANGFRPYGAGEKLSSGDRIYRINRGKAVTFAVIGTEPLSSGANIAAAHIDAPRLDLKQTPLYEDGELAYLKTHYYGGIKKYQWVAIPLELRGVVSLKNGRNIEVRVGAEKDDPMFTITDLLPHLGTEQMKKPLGEAISGEGLNILVGSRPFENDKGIDRIKLSVMTVLNDKYGITEEDFISAELSAVPAFDARDVGFDRSLIGGYGHDDRVCSYPAFAAILQTERPKKTAVCILTDKEEIGSEGVTGLKSASFDTFMSDLCQSQGVELKRCFENSFCLSADVTNAFDPNFPDVSDKRNSAKINYGVALSKYTGSRGKSGSSDASAEVVAAVRALFEKAGVIWQMTELGKVDTGGGGTVAMFMAQRNIDTIDAGVPVLSMHAPYEVVSKLDVYMTFKGMRALFNDKP